MRFLVALIALSSVTFAACAADVQRSPYGTTAEGEKVEVFTLRNDHGMTVSVLSYGGILTGISVPDRNAGTANVVLALRDLKAYEARANFSGWRIHARWQALRSCQQCGWDFFARRSARLRRSQLARRNVSSRQGCWSGA